MTNNKRITNEDLVDYNQDELNDVAAIDQWYDDRAVRSRRNNANGRIQDRNFNIGQNERIVGDGFYQNDADRHQVPDRPHSPLDPQPRPDARNNSSYVWIILGLSIAAYFIFTLCSNSRPNTCNMQAAENRDFNRYYGINGTKNHFTTPAADECNAHTIFRPALPQTILKSDFSASSFLTLAKYGTGKTLLRCEYVKSLKSNDYLKILILNKQISEYIERFVKEKDCENKNCLQGWSENEFAQLLLSTLVTEYITEAVQKGRTKCKDIAIEEKIQLITIICYYYNGIGTGALERFINSFLEKSPGSSYQASTAVVQIQERNVAQDKPLLVHFKTDLSKFSVLNQDYERLYLLLAVMEGEGFQHKAIRNNVYGNVLNDLTKFSLYIKKQWNKTPVFIVDGIDENRYFFQKKAVSKASMESFCRSSVSQEIISKVMANNFYLSIFYPKIDGIEIQDVVIRKDKFSIHGIDWNIKSLINYADYVLQEMNKIASSARCEAFTDFKTLVNYSNKRIAEIINRIPTPRALHYFMIELIPEMNNDANEVQPPFRATFENVHNAYEKAYEHFNRIQRVQQ